MLGGFGHLASKDVRSSKKFISNLKSKLPGTGLVLDVGAGIGRVSHDLLLSVFDKVSLLECTLSFIEQAKHLISSDRIGKIFPVTMQEFRAAEEDYGLYDMIWIQWVIIYANDEGLVEFLSECKKLLKPSGLICIKDNVILNNTPHEQIDDILLDKEDCSITRSERYLLHLTQQAGLSLSSRELQPKFPKELFPVVMYAFQVND